MSYQRTVVIAIILALGAFSLFGLLAMSADHSGSMHRCITAAATGAACPNTFNPFSFAFFHIGGWRMLSTGALATALSFWVAFIALIALSATLLLRAYDPLSQSPVFSYSTSRTPRTVPLRLALSRWLAIHIESPSA